MGEAMAHTGTHIADLRESPMGRNLFQLEGRAWGVTVMSAINNKEKTLTLPGGYVVWNSTSQNVVNCVIESGAALLREKAINNVDRFGHGCDQLVAVLDAECPLNRSVQTSQDRKSERQKSRPPTPSSSHIGWENRRGFRKSALVRRRKEVSNPR
jgi:hypothetical protein